jgi:hypothetical protein
VITSTPNTAAVMLHARIFFPLTLPSPTEGEGTFGQFHHARRWKIWGNPYNWTRQVRLLFHEVLKRAIAETPCAPLSVVIFRTSFFSPTPSSFTRISSNHTLGAMRLSGVFPTCTLGSNMG